MNNYHGFTASLVLRAPDIDQATLHVNTRSDPFPVVKLGDFTILGDLDLADVLRDLADRVEYVMEPHLPVVPAEVA
jgi:hypothetical protein